MALTIIDLGHGRAATDEFWDRLFSGVDDERNPEVRARKAQARAESMWTRPMREARGDQELPKP